MIDTLAMLGRASLEWLWIPTLAWTVLAGVGILSMRLVPARLALARYRMRQALLFSLPATLLLGPIVPGVLPAGSPPTFLDPTGADGPLPTSSAIGADAVVASVDVVGLGAGAITALVVAIALAQLARLLIRLRELRNLARAAPPVGDPDALRLFEHLTSRVGLRRTVLLLTGPGDSVPMTFGWRAPVIVVPEGLVARPEELRPALLHELIHVARADFAWATAERTVCAVFGFHPLVWALSRGADADRESACDAEVIGAGEVSRESYASLLYSLAQSPHPPLGIAAGLAVPTSQLKQRIETMKDFSTEPVSRRTRTHSRLAAVVLLLATAGFAACLDVTETSSTDFDVTGMTTDELLAFVGSSSVESQLGNALARLEVQLAYLDDELTEMIARSDEAVAASQRGEEVAEWGRKDWTRLSLLRDMYEERLREYEFLKLEAIANAELSR